MDLNISYKTCIKATVLLSLFFFSIYLSGLTVHSLKALFLSGSSIINLALVTAIFIANFYLVSARLYLCYRQFNLHITYSAAKHAIIAGQVGGIFPVFGSVLSQSVNLKQSSQISPMASTFIYFYERILITICGGIMSLLIAYHCVEDWLSMNVGPQKSHLLEYCIVILMTFFSVWRFSLSLEDRDTFKSYFSIRNVKYFMLQSTLSISSWVLSALCFFVCIYFSTNSDSTQTIAYQNVFFLSILVSFLSSLPLSVSGWGIREFSAMAIFSILSIPKEVSLYSAISVGVFSLFALLLLATFFYLKTKIFNKVEQLNVKKLSYTAVPLKKNTNYQIDVYLFYWMPVVAAILVFFQAYFVFGEVNVNINTADIFAICALVTLLLVRYEVDFTIPYTKKIFVAMLGAFIFSFLVGVYRFGFTSFSFFSKLIGFFILVGYCYLGILFMHLMKDRKQFYFLSKTMLIALSSIIIYQMMINIFSFYYDRSLLGYAVNRNAFAFQILCVISMQLSVLTALKKHIDKKTIWLLSILFAGIFFTYSRSGICTALVLLSSSALLGLLTKKDVLNIVTKVFILILSVYCLENLTNMGLHVFNIDQTNDFLYHKTQFTLNKYSPSTSSSQRLYSIVEGLALWRKSPWFGIGLGGFLNHETIKNGTPLVIHNTFVWMLVEFGLVGSIIFFTYGFLIVKKILCLIKRIKPEQWGIQDKLLFYLLIIFLLMGSVHEIFYQRIFWIVFGLSIVQSTKLRAIDT